jgi:uncharacterized membrane protein YGL010W
VKADSKLMEMLTGYAAAHQHPANIGVHLLGIPVIMFGVFIVLSWVGISVNDFQFDLAQLAVIGMFAFYLTLDRIFALAFLLAALPLAFLAAWVGREPLAVSGTIAGIAFFGGYAAQFIGHAIEKSAPVIFRHPVQANLAAPFFTIVEVFKLCGLRAELFQRVQQGIEKRREESRRTA